MAPGGDIGAKHTSPPQPGSQASQGSLFASLSRFMLPINPRIVTFSRLQALRLSAG